MQKLIYSKSDNLVNLIDTNGNVECTIKDVVSVEPDSRRYVVKVLNGNDPRGTIKLMCPINMTNLFIEK